MLRLFAAALVGLAVMLGTAALASRVDEPFFVIIGGVLLAFVGAPWAVLHVWRPVDAVERARRSGTLEVRQFDIVRAWQIGQREDEGLHFALELASGGTLFLSGQFLYEPVHNRCFPCKSITVSRDVRSGEVLGIDGKGTLVETGTPLEAFSDQELDADTYPGAYRLYAEPANDVLRMLGRASPLME